MDLFSHTSGPHMAHFHVEHHQGGVELEWEVRNAEPLRWRVLRSDRGFAEYAEPPGTNGQVRVSEGQNTYLRDEGLDPQRNYFYTVFSQEPDGTWQRQVEAKTHPRKGLHWSHPDADETFTTERSFAETGVVDPGSIGTTVAQRAAFGCLRVGHLTGD